MTKQKILIKENIHYCDKNCIPYLENQHFDGMWICALKKKEKLDNKILEISNNRSI